MVFVRILSRLCKDVRMVYGLNVVGLWVDVQGELCYRDILVYGLVEYMDYDIGSLGKDLAQMDGVRDVLNNPDPQEWLANVMGMYGFGAVKRLG